MTCTDVGEHLDAYLDGELDADRARSLARHLDACAACRAAYERRRALGAALRERAPTFAAPDLLRERVSGALREASAGDLARRLRGWRRAAIAASVVAVAATGYAAAGAWHGTGSALPGLAGTDRTAIASEVLASHVRSLMPGHLTDVPSTDQHTVKPWFDGRLDYSPPVYDFAAQGFPLIGGRLDYIAGRPVAALAYQRRKHTVNLFLWPADARDRVAPERTQQGYHMLHWTSGGMTYWAVSDLNGDELREFVHLEQRADSLAGARERGP